MISICYITSRLDPKVQWFLDSLDMLTNDADKSEIEIIFIDRLAKGTERQRDFFEVVGKRFRYSHVTPKPCVWQGDDRLTAEDWFAASNARNTGLIMAQGETIAFVDDLSVLTGQWWKALKESTGSTRVTCGAYRKVKELRVDNGNIIHSYLYAGGADNRWQYGNDNGPVPCEGNWLYGCSFSCPTQYLIDVNGFDEACDGMGFEDCIMGIRLANRGVQFQYDRRLLTYESEEDHHLDKIMRRTDKGVSPHDKSHAILDKARTTDRAENFHLGPEGIAGLRKIYAESNLIPFPEGPTHDWFDGQLIAEMI